LAGHEWSVGVVEYWSSGGSQRGIGSKMDDRRNIHHRGTEVAEFGEMFLIK
jgi:hypothetical protein